MNEVKVDLNVEDDAVVVDVDVVVLVLFASVRYRDGIRTSLLLPVCGLARFVSIILST